MRFVEERFIGNEPCDVEICEETDGETGEGIVIGDGVLLVNVDGEAPNWYS